MSKHEIRLRRQKFGARGSDRFRNYGEVLQRHEKEVRLKKVLRVFTYLFIIMIIIMMIVIVVRVEKRMSQKPTPSIVISPTQHRPCKFSVTYLQES